MAVLTVENTAKVGKPVRVFGADGREIKDVIEADTATGLCVVYQRDEKGRFMLAPEGDHIVRKEVFGKLPLMVKAVI